MSLENLSPAPGSRKPRKRKGRGMGSGNGKTAGKGHKGQKARAGGSTPLGFEGGQMPLYRRLPKRGFNNGKFRKVYVTLNVADLERLDAGAEVTLESLLESGLVKRGKANQGLKVLGNGELTKALTIKAEKFSKSAVEKIEAAGGTVEVI